MYGYQPTFFTHQTSVTIIPAAEGSGHDRKIRFAHFFEPIESMEDNTPLCDIDGPRLFERFGKTGVLP